VIWTVPDCSADCTAHFEFDGLSAADTILSVKERVFAANPELPVHRQRLVNRHGPRSMDALADDETLYRAGVAEIGFFCGVAYLDLFEVLSLDRKVWSLSTVVLHGLFA
jgi:hypothetical protein